MKTDKQTACKRQPKTALEFLAAPAPEEGLCYFGPPKLRKYFEQAMAQTNFWDSLTYDHKDVGGWLGANFAQSVKDALEEQPESKKATDAPGAAPGPPGSEDMLNGLYLSRKREEGNETGEGLDDENGEQETHVDNAGVLAGEPPKITSELVAKAKDVLDKFWGDEESVTNEKIAEIRKESPELAAELEKEVLRLRKVNQQIKAQKHAENNGRANNYASEYLDGVERHNDFYDQVNTGLSKQMQSVLDQASNISQNVDSLRNANTASNEQLPYGTTKSLSEFSEVYFNQQQNEKGYNLLSSGYQSTQLTSSGYSEPPLGSLWKNATTMVFAGTAEFIRPPATVLAQTANGMKYVGYQNQPILGTKWGFGIGMGVSTISHAINWGAGFGDGITFASNVAADAVTTAGTIGIVAATTKVFASFGVKTRNPLVIAGYTTAGFVIGVGLDMIADHYGLQKEIEHGLRSLEAKDLHSPTGVYRNLNNFREFQLQRDASSSFRERFQLETEYIQHNKQLNYWEKQKEYKNELKRRQEQKRGNYLPPIG